MRRRQESRPSPRSRWPSNRGTRLSAAPCWFPQTKTGAIPHHGIAPALNLRKHCRRYALLLNVGGAGAADSLAVGKNRADQLAAARAVSQGMDIDRDGIARLQ